MQKYHDVIAARDLLRDGFARGMHAKYYYSMQRFCLSIASLQLSHPDITQSKTSKGRSQAPKRDFFVGLHG
eukprot:COSAG06_NODE_422_length_15966_cov_34.618832_2_plen_71_part_00